LRGGNELLGQAKKRLKSATRKSTTDGNFLAGRVECIGACTGSGHAGQLRLYENLTPMKFDASSKNSMPAITLLPSR